MNDENANGVIIIIHVNTMPLPLQPVQNLVQLIFKGVQLLRLMQMIINTDEECTCQEMKRIKEHSTNIQMQQSVHLKTKTLTKGRKTENEKER